MSCSIKGAGDLVELLRRATKKHNRTFGTRWDSCVAFMQVPQNEPPAQRVCLAISFFFCWVSGCVLRFGFLK